MDEPQLTARQESAIWDAMRRAGEMMTAASDIGAGLQVKPGTRNYVTAYDSAVQRMLMAELSRIVPEAAFLGEEEERHSLPPRRLCFVVDPIDGTTNFLHGCRCSVISVGAVWEGEAVWGAVWNPYTRELFTARRGGGAFCNGAPIHVSAFGLSDALVGIGTSPYIREENHAATFRLAEAIFLRCADIRRSGAAAWDLCSVACGRLDAFFEWTLGPWDYCAGSVILTEAGGRITRMDGGPLLYGENCSVLAANGACRDELTALLAGL